MALDRQYWDNRWQNQDTGWDMGQVSPPLQAYFDQLPDKTIRTLIPGCGNCYEAAYLLEKGFTDITLIDISDTLIEKLQSRLTGPRLIAGDFFEHNGVYDLIVEQTFFCAQAPSLRPAYADKMQELLEHGGHLAGLLFDKEFEGGPPFGGTRAEYLALLEGRLKVKTMEACYNSIAPRAGSELFFIAEKV